MGPGRDRRGAADLAVRLRQRVLDGRGGDRARGARAGSRAPADAAAPVRAGGAQGLPAGGEARVLDVRSRRPRAAAAAVPGVARRRRRVPRAGAARAGRRRRRRRGGVVRAGAIAPHLRRHAEAVLERRLPHRAAARGRDGPGDAGSDTGARRRIRAGRRGLRLVLAAGDAGGRGRRRRLRSAAARRARGSGSLARAGSRLAHLGRVHARRGGGLAGGRSVRDADAPGPASG